MRFGYGELRALACAAVVSTVTALGAYSSPAVAQALQPGLLLTCPDLEGLKGRFPELFGQYQTLLDQCVAAGANSTIDVPVDAYEQSIKILAVGRPPRTARDPTSAVVWDERRGRFNSSFRELAEKNRSRLAMQHVAKPIPPLTAVSVTPDNGARTKAFYSTMTIYFAAPIRAARNERIIRESFPSLDKASIQAGSHALLTCVDVASLLSGMSLSDAVRFESIFQPCYERPNTALLVQLATLRPLLKPEGAADLPKLHAANLRPFSELARIEAKVQAEAAQNAIQAAKLEEAKQLSIARKEQEQRLAQEEQAREVARWNALTPEQRAAENARARERNCNALSRLSAGYEITGDVNGLRIVNIQRRNLGC